MWHNAASGRNAAQTIASGAQVLQLPTKSPGDLVPVALLRSSGTCERSAIRRRLASSANARGFFGATARAMRTTRSDCAPNPSRLAPQIQHTTDGSALCRKGPHRPYAAIRLTLCGPDSSKGGVAGGDTHKILQSTPDKSTHNPTTRTDTGCLLFRGGGEQVPQARALKRDMTRGLERDSKTNLGFKSDKW